MLHIRSETFIQPEVVPPVHGDKISKPLGRRENKVYKKIYLIVVYLSIATIMSNQYGTIMSPHGYLQTLGAHFNLNARFFS